MDLAGKHVIVTGANTGIGRVTALELGRLRAHVTLAGRSEERTRPVVEEIRQAGGNADFLKLDLADLSNVRAAAESYESRSVPLAVLVNNAGLAGSRGTTKDGFERTFGTNHLGPYLFTRLLTPALERSGSSRVVNVASVAHYEAKAIPWDALRKPTVSKTGLAEYAVSKLANVLFSNELARRGAVGGIHSYALHPGVVASDVWRTVPFGLRHLMKLFMLSNEQGAKTSLYCATSDQTAGDTGLYYDKCRPKRPSRLALDEALARELWEKSAAWVGLPA